MMESRQGKRRRISVASIRAAGSTATGRRRLSRQHARGSPSSAAASGLSNIRQKILTQLLTLLHKDQHRARTRNTQGSASANTHTRTQNAASDEVEAAVGGPASSGAGKAAADEDDDGGQSDGGHAMIDGGDGEGDYDGDGDGDGFGFLPLPDIADLPDDDDGAPEATDLAAEIESRGHDLYHAKNKYKPRMQSIIFNLKRYKALRQKVLSGEMTPEQLCLASSEEMQASATASEVSLLAKIQTAGASRATLQSGSLSVQVDKKEGGTKMEWFAGKDDDDDDEHIKRGFVSTQSDDEACNDDDDDDDDYAAAAAGDCGDASSTTPSKPRTVAFATATSRHQQGRGSRGGRGHAVKSPAAAAADVAAQAAWKGKRFSSNVSQHLVSREASTAGPSRTDILRSLSAGRRAATSSFNRQGKDSKARGARQAVLRAAGPQGKDGQLDKRDVVAFAKPLLMAVHRTQPLGKDKFKTILRGVVQAIMQRNKQYDKKIVEKLITAQLYL